VREIKTETHIHASPDGVWPIQKKGTEMSTDSAAHELHVTSIDGRVSRFHVEGAAAVKELLERVQPNRVFTQPHLIVSDRCSLSIFPSAGVVRVDLVAERFPDWPFFHGATDIQELSLEEFEQRYQPEAYEQASGPAEGAPIVVFAEVELASGQRVFLEAHARAEIRLPVEQGLFLQQLLSAHSLFARRRGGGAVLLNPANVVRLTFRPGPVTVPPHAIDAVPMATGDSSEFVLVLNE
jgi:hypothetical protein